ncbi:MAG TPA: hypothetical protein VFP68_11730 [Burkholderiaceae bacterium]|nr:hypothetical protein [Burkholderiaceae bacterium]
MLETILKQQMQISERLTKLIAAFGDEPEPVEPILRSMLKPVTEDICEMREALAQSSQTSPGS